MLVAGSRHGCRGWRAFGHRRAWDSADLRLGMAVAHAHLMKTAPFTLLFGGLLGGGGTNGGPRTSDAAPTAREDAGRADAAPTIRDDAGITDAALPHDEAGKSDRAAAANHDVGGADGMAKDESPGKVPETCWRGGWR